jgi:hypothetical protein
MSVEGFLSAIGLGDLLAADFFLTQIGLLTGAGLLFLCSLVACLLAFRAAGSAQRARIQAETQFRSAQSLASEIRHLTAQIELAAKRPATADAGYAAALDLGEEAMATRADHAGLEAGDAALEAAKKAATEPSALLRGRRRRR